MGGGSNYHGVNVLPFSVNVESTLPVTFNATESTMTLLRRPSTVKLRFPLTVGVRRSKLLNVNGTAVPVVLMYGLVTPVLYWK